MIKVERINHHGLIRLIETPPVAVVNHNFVVVAVDVGKGFNHHMSLFLQWHLPSCIGLIFHWQLDLRFGYWNTRQILCYLRYKFIQLIDVIKAKPIPLNQTLNLNYIILPTMTSQKITVFPTRCLTLTPNQMTFFLSHLSTTYSLKYYRIQLYIVIMPLLEVPVLYSHLLLFSFCCIF